MLPAILQSLPDNALLFPTRGNVSPEVLAVECDPQIITLPGATAALATADDPGNARPAANPGNWPTTTPHGQQPAWPPRQDSPADSLPAWPPPQPAPRWPPQRG